MYNPVFEKYYYICSMKPRRILQFFVFLLAVLAQSMNLSAIERPKRLGDAITDLDEAIANREVYREHCYRSIDSLRARYVASSDFDICRRLSNAFADVNADSAFYYLYQSHDIAESRADFQAHSRVLLDYANMLHRGMLYADALDVIDSVNVASLSRADSIAYYSILSRTCMSASQQQILFSSRNYYRSRALIALDSLVVFFPAGTVARHITQAQIYYLKGDMTLGVGELNEAYESMEPRHEAYAALTSMLAAYYKTKPSSRDEYLYYLALSAASDVRSVNGEPLSLVALASELFSDGDVDRAYSYLNAAAETLNSSGSTLLSTDIIKPLTEVNSHILARESRARNKYLVIIGVCCVVTLLFVILYVARRRSIAQRDKLIQSLSDTVSNRELYISQLLNICSVYLESMEDFNRLVGRKLKAGQAKDLYADVESGKWLHECNERFFEAFDAAVLKIYPDFLAQVNRLLQPDKPLAQPASGRLSPELRIIAFMLLGVEDSTRISKFLGLSLTAIYTYRNRVKSRAIDKDNFDANILKIGKIA